MKRGIDVSRWQGLIDWKKVRNNIDFAIIKAGGSDAGFYTDGKWEYNFYNARKNKIPIGAYYIPGKLFQGTENGAADAKRFVKILGSRTLEYPVCLDIELQPTGTKRGNTEAAIAFCEYMEREGFYVSIYASDFAGFRERLDMNKLKAYDKWVAKYSSTEPSYCKDWGMWQYSSLGRIPGITTMVDLDFSRKDYPSIIKKAKLNNY